MSRIFLLASLLFGIGGCTFGAGPAEHLAKHFENGRQLEFMDMNNGRKIDYYLGPYASEKNPDYEGGPLYLELDIERLKIEGEDLPTSVEKPSRLIPCRGMRVIKLACFSDDVFTIVNVQNPIFDFAKAVDKLVNALREEGSLKINEDGFFYNKNPITKEIINRFTEETDLEDISKNLQTISEIYPTYLPLIPDYNALMSKIHVFIHALRQDFPEPLALPRSLFNRGTNWVILGDSSDRDYKADVEEISKDKSKREFKVFIANERLNAQEREFYLELPSGDDLLGEVVMNYGRDQRRFAYCPLKNTTDRNKGTLFFAAFESYIDHKGESNILTFERIPIFLIENFPFIQGNYPNEAERNLDLMDEWLQGCSERCSERETIANDFDQSRENYDPFGYILSSYFSKREKLSENYLRMRAFYEFVQRNISGVKHVKENTYKAKQLEKYRSIKEKLDKLFDFYSRI